MIIIAVGSRRSLETEESVGWFGATFGQTRQRTRASAVVRGGPRLHRDAGGLGPVHGSRRHGHGAQRR